MFNRRILGGTLPNIPYSSNAFLYQLYNTTSWNQIYHLADSKKLLEWMVPHSELCFRNRFKHVNPEIVIYQRLKMTLSWSIEWHRMMRFASSYLDYKWWGANFWSVSFIIQQSDHHQVISIAIDSFRVFHISLQERRNFGCFTIISSKSIYLVFPLLVPQ